MRNKTFRLFVSSTFDDFKEERYLLHNEVYPEVRTFCNERGYEFQIVDLRWGVYTESTMNHKTLPICLDEVDRCKAFSPRPNFLAMIGGRYGWVPLPPFVAKEELDAILSCLDDECRKTVTRWYLFDANEEGGQYYLKPRGEDFSDNDKWSGTENQLRALLVEGATKAGFSDELLVKYTASATEHEIIHGILADKNMSDSSIVVFRNGSYSSSQDEEKIEALKERIAACLDSHSDRLINLSLDNSRPVDDYNNSFVESLKQALCDAIKLEIERLESYADVRSDEQRLLPYYNENTVYYGDPEAYQRLVDYVNGSSRQVMFLEGGPGAGKTTLLAKFLTDQKKMPLRDVSFAFYGESSWACSIFDTLEHMTEEICLKQHISMPRDHQQSAAQRFIDALNNAMPIFKHVIVIDGVDMFSDTSLLRENFLPDVLPKNIKIIISSAKAEAIDLLASDEDIRLSLNNMSPENCSDCFDGLMHLRHRTLADSTQRRLVNSALMRGCPPIQVKLLSSLASRWVSGRVIDSVPPTAFEAAREYISSSFDELGHEREMVLYALALITVAPLGLAENDLLDMLVKFESVKAHQEKESRHNNTFEQMPFAIWSRFFYDMSECLDLYSLEGDIVVRFTHNIFPTVMRECYSSYCAEALDVLLDYLRGRISLADNSFNTRCAKAYLLLLHSRGKNDELAELITNPAFVDSYIRGGGTNHLAELLCFIAPHLSKSKGLDAAANTLIDCLNDKWSMLNRYRSSFLSCAYERGIVDSCEPYLYVPSERERNHSNDGAVSFRYSSNSKVEYSPRGTMYAVYDERYLYVCDAMSHIERTKIYIRKKDSSDDGAIMEIKWLDELVIAIINYDGGVFVYNIGLDIPKVALTFKCNPENPFITLLPEENKLIYCQKDGVICIDAANGERHYKIALSDDNTTCFDRTNGQLIVYSYDIIGASAYKIYDARSGSLLQTISNDRKQKHLYPSREHRIFALHLNRTLQLMEEKGKEGFLVYDRGRSKHYYLHPPAYKEIIQNVVGRRFLLSVYENGIFVTDLLDFSTRFLTVTGISNVSWHIVDSTITIVTRERRLMEVSLSDFTTSDGAFVSDHNLFYGSIETMGAGVGDSVMAFSSIFPTGEPKEYRTAFNDFFTHNAHQHKPGEFVIPTLAVVAPDGKRAVAYEYLDSVALLDWNGRLLFSVDELHLGVDNNILRLAFSPDSKYLLIWTNNYVRVIAVDSANVVCNLSVAFRPAISVEITHSNFLRMMLCDGNVYEAPLSVGGARFTSVIPSRIKDPVHRPLFRYAYYSNPFGDIWPEFNIVMPGHVEFMERSWKWLNHRRGYFGKRHWLLYLDGRFYLDGSMDRPFITRDLYDFVGSSNETLASYSSSFETFISEKNDITSSLYEYEAEGFLLLVCRKMNSVILFDMHQMSVVAAYKPNEQIIGSVLEQGGKYLILFLNASGREIKMKVNLPGR